MRVLVTGATGFTGRRVTAALARDGHDVTAFVRPTSDRAVIASLGVPTIEGDLSDLKALESALRGFELVNVASLGFGHAPGIVEAAKRAGVRRSVFLGTTAVRTTLPAPSKAIRLEAERVVLAGEIGATLLRPTMIYGAAGDRNMERLLRFVRRWPIVPVPGDGRGLQQPVHVEDVAAAIAAVLPRADCSGMAFDIPGPAPLTFDDVILTVVRVLGKRRLLLHVPRFLGRLVASREQLARLAEDKSCDAGAAGRAFGFSPRSFEDGIREEVRAMGLLS
jgi:nucleoside-diphosphate-sugar epimerase